MNTNNYTSISFNVNDVKDELKNTPSAALSVFSAFCGVSPQIIAYWQEHQKQHPKGAPCPVCGGVDRFNIIDPNSGRGLIGVCRKCGGRWNPIDLALAVHTDWNLDEACRQIGEFIGLSPREGKSSRRSASKSRKPTAETVDDSPRRNEVRIINDPEPLPAPTVGEAVAPLPKTGKGLEVFPFASVQLVKESDEYQAEGAPSILLREVRTEAEKDGRRVAWIDPKSGDTLEKFFKREHSTNGGKSWANGWNKMEPLPLAWASCLETLKEPGAALIITEGAKKGKKLGDALRAAGVPFVVSTLGSSTAAKRWEQYAEEVPSSVPVFILADNDEPGRRAAEITAQAFNTPDRQAGRVVSFTRRPDGSTAPAGYDVGDWLEDLHPASDADALTLFENWTQDPQNVQTLKEAAEEPERKENLPNGKEAPSSAEDEEEEQRNADALEARRERLERVERAQIADALALAVDDEIERAGLEALPECIRGYVQEVHEKFRYSRAALSFSALACVAAFGGHKFYFQDSSEDIWSGELFFPFGVVTVGDSSSGKTVIKDQFSFPLVEIENKGKQAYTTAAAKYKEEVKQRKQNGKELKALENKLRRRKSGAIDATPEEIEELKKRIIELEERSESPEPEPPKVPAVYTMGIKTPEAARNKICENLVNGYIHGILINPDEGQCLFSVNGGVQAALERFNVYNHILDGNEFNEYTVTTFSAGEYHLPGKKFAGMMVFIQTDIFCDYLKHKGLVSQGFPNRFIKVHTPLVVRNCRYSNAEKWRFVKDRYRKIFQWMNTNPGAVFELTKEAKELFREFLEEHGEAQSEALKRRDNAEYAFLNKLGPRALVFACLARIGDFIDRVPGSFWVIDQIKPEGIPSNSPQSFDEFAEFSEPAEGAEEREEAPNSGTLINIKIDVQTLERGIALVEWAAALTRACDNRLVEEVKRGEQQIKIERFTTLEQKVLKAVKESGEAGATDSEIVKAKGLHQLRGGKKTKAGKQREEILSRLWKRGEIIKRGARYYIAELSDDENAEETTEEKEEE